MCICLLHFTGAAFVTKYGTIFVKGLGTMDPLEFGILERGLGLLGPITLICTVDRFGRRPMLLTTGTMYGVCLFVIGGIGMMSAKLVGEAIIAFYIIAAILHIISFHGV